MTPGEKKVAVVVGAAAATGLLVLLWPKKADGKALPPKDNLPDQTPMFAAVDAYGVLDKAAKFETDVALLKDLRDKVLAASIADHRWDPYWTRIQQRLEFLVPGERLQYVPQGGMSSGTMSLSQAAFASR